MQWAEDGQLRRLVDAPRPFATPVAMRISGSLTPKCVAASDIDIARAQGHRPGFIRSPTGFQIYLKGVLSERLSTATLVPRARVWRN